MANTTAPIQADPTTGLTGSKLIAARKAASQSNQAPAQTTGGVSSPVAPTQ